MEFSWKIWKLKYSIYNNARGQLIFEMSFWCLKIDQKNNEIFLRISALAYKKRLNQKKINKGTLFLFLFYNYLKIIQLGPFFDSTFL